jgi:hypothetical protein
VGLLRARSVTTAEAELLKSAVSLRWSRPDLTAAVAEHVATTWAADNRTWVAATGWLVYGRAAVGDGRECASDALDELLRRDPALLDDPAADRLRIEVATLAAAQREPAVARKLVEPLGHDRPAEVRADALAVLARCAFEDRPTVVSEATRRATEAWAAVRGADAEIAVAALTFLSATAARRAGHPAAAADHAAEGLARLDDLRPGASAPHLAAALAAEWISALVEAGRAEDACESCAATAKLLVPTARPTRQIALLRLTVARALAESSSSGAFEALEQAAADASASDAPDLEGLCLSTLGTLREHAGRLDAALESMRRGVAAQRRDRARSERFRAALSALPLASAAPVGAAVRQKSLVPLPAVRRRSRGGEGGSVDQPHPLAANPWTTGRWTSEPSRSDDGVRHQTAPGADVAFDRPRVDAGSAAPPGPRLQPEIAAADASPTDTAFDPLFGSLGEIGEQEPAGPAAREPATTAPSATTDEAAHDGEGWLATALADLERAWGAPLPELARTVGLPDEGRVPERPSAAPSSLVADTTAPDQGASRDGGADAFDEEAASPWASWTDEDVVDPEPRSARGGGRARDDDGVRHGSDGAERRDDDVHAADLGGMPGGGDRPGSSAMGCVVVVDVVCAGAAVPEATALLARLVADLTDRVPAGARMRLDESESTLCVVMPGQERTVAAGWMHRTLPAVFHDVAASDDGALPVGSALRATVHDTDGPVGAQLLQRLEAGRRSPATAPLVPIRWGVPIAPGSGGRRRRPDGDGRVVADTVGTSGGQGRHRDGPNDGPAPAFGSPAFGRPRPDAGNGTNGPKRHAAPPSEPRVNAALGSPAAAVGSRRRAPDGGYGVRGGPTGEGRWVAGDGREVAWRDTRRGVATGQKWYVAGVSGTDLRLDVPSAASPVVVRGMPGDPATGARGDVAGQGAAAAGAPRAGTSGADLAPTDAVGPGTAWPGTGPAGAGVAGADMAGAASAGMAVTDVAGAGVANVDEAGPDAAGASVEGADVAGASVASAGAARGGAVVGEPAGEAGEGAARSGGRAVGAEDSPPPSVAGGQAAGSGAAAGAPAGSASRDAELSVEGLGLADLLAGALAAYRAI